jgi:hypothetical protein
MTLSRRQFHSAILGTAATAFSQQNPQFVDAQGKNLLGSDGKPILLRGINLGNWLEPGIQLLKRCGMNCVRIPLHWKFFTAEGKDFNWVGPYHRRVPRSKAARCPRHALRPWRADRHQHRRQLGLPYVDFRNQYNVPVWLGESGENDDTWVEQFRKTLESNNIGWRFWPYKKLVKTSCPVSVKEPEHWNDIAALAKMQPGTGNAAKRTAVRPSPEICKQALDSLLRSIRFEACTVNEGYLRALGLRAG